MPRLIDAIRWHNDISPWHRPKASVTKRVVRRLDRTAGPKVYHGIQGDLAMRLDLAVRFEQDIYMNIYEPVVVGIFRRVLRPGDRVVDAEANIGLLTLVASRCVGPTGRVYAWEPQPEALHRLRENIDLNHIENVTTIPKGCWHEPGHATLNSFADDGIDGVSMGRRSDREVDHEMRIETARIDSEVTPPVRLIKCDVEGAERSALRGCEALLQADRPPHLIVELKTITAQAFGYHPMELVEELLTGRNYRLHEAKGRRRRRTSVAGVRKLLDEQPGKSHNIWFEPV